MIDYFALALTHALILIAILRVFMRDGLDREEDSGLDREIERLHKSCRRLIWLNPMLRFEGYEPRAMGNRAIMPYVDDFRPIHNLNSLAALVDVLSGPAANAAAMAEWRKAAAGGRESGEYRRILHDSR